MDADAVAVVQWTDGTRTELVGINLIMFVQDALDDIHEVLTMWMVEGFAAE